MKQFLFTFLALFYLLTTASTQAAPGDLDFSFDAGSALDHSAIALAIQPDGKILIGGEFSTVPGLVRHRIARLNPDGTGDASFNPGLGPSGPVRSIFLQPDGKILVGGLFTNFNGVALNRIARLNSDGSLDTHFNPGRGADNLVRSMALQSDGKILIVGYFTHVAGVRRNYLARLNADGSLDASFNAGSGPNYYAYSVLLQPDGRIIVGGDFTTFNTTTAHGVVRLFPDGMLDTSFAGSHSADVMALQPDGRLLVGSFSLARLNPDGTRDRSFHANLEEGFGSIALQSDGKILVGGQFYSVEDRRYNYLARLNPDGSLDRSFAPPLQLYPPGVTSIAVEPQGTVLVSAGIFSVNGLGPKNLVRLNADGSLNDSLDSSTGLNGYGVYSADLQPDGKILVAGYFGGFNNHRRQGIARLHSDGHLDESFEAGEILNAAYYSISNPVVYSVALQADGKVIIGGGFTNINQTSRNNIARLNADGSVDASFNPGTGTDYQVYRVVLQPDGRTLIAGGFLLVDGAERDSFARLNHDGSLDSRFNPNIGFVYDAAVQPDGKIAAVGYTFTNRAIKNFITRLNPDGSVDPSFHVGTGPDNMVYSVALQSDGKLLVIGDFTEINGTSRRGMARLNSDGSLDLSFNPRMTTGGTGDPLRGTLLQPDGKILVSGTFYDSRLHGVIARMNPDGSADASFAPCTVLGFAVPMALQSDSKVVIGGSFSTANGVPRAAIARLLGDAPIIISQPASRTNAVGTTATFTVNASGAPVLTYEWYSDGAPLTDNPRVFGTTTATLTIKHLQFRDAAAYTVVVSNNAGAATSETAFLGTVVPSANRKQASR